MTRHLAIIAGIVAIAPVAARAQSSSTTQTTKTTASDRADPRANPPNTQSTTVDQNTTGTHSAAMSSNEAGTKAMTNDQLLQQLHKIDQQEIMAGQLAEKKGSTQPVKDYGRMLVQDHEKADKQVMQVAQKEHVSLTAKNDLPQTVREKDRVNKEKMEQVQRMSGKEFDRAFAQVMSNGHQEAIDMVKNAQANAKGDMKNLLDQLLPDLQKHKDVADQILSSTGNTASAK